MNDHQPIIYPPLTESNPFEERVRAEEGNQAVSAEPTEKSLEPPRDQILIADGQLCLTNIEQVWRAAKLIRQSGLAPSSFSNDQQLVIAILRALELKIPIFQALEGMTVIKGKIGIMGDLALALTQASGLLESKKVEYSGEGESLSCSVTLKRRKRAAQTYSFSVAEAKAAGISNSPTWRAYPKRMLYYRSLGFGLRDEFPDVLKGLKTSEELADYPENHK
jgi:hypothetical protein